MKYYIYICYLYIWVVMHWHTFALARVYILPITKALSWQVQDSGNFIVLSHWRNWATSTMTIYPTQSHSPDIESYPRNTLHNSYKLCKSIILLGLDSNLTLSIRVTNKHFYWLIYHSDCLINDRYMGVAPWPDILLSHIILTLSEPVITLS